MNKLETWLLEKENPSIRYRTLTELLDKKPDDSDVIQTRKQILSSQPVRNIFGRMHPDGYWLQKNPRSGEVVGQGVEYGAFASTHFVLAYLTELGLDKTNPQVKKAAQRYLNLQQPDGDFFRHFSCIYSYNIRTFLLLGYKDDPRVQKTINLMLTTTRPDGGYLCDMHEGKYKTKTVKSCIRGSTRALVAFAELAQYWQHPRCKALINYFLQRNCLFRMDNPKAYINHDVQSTSFPITWRASLLDIIFALSKMGYGKHKALQKAWQLLESKKDSRGHYILDWTPTQVQKLWKIGKRVHPNKWITFYTLLAKKAMEQAKI